MSKKTVVADASRTEFAWCVFITIWALASLMHLWNQLPWPVGTVQAVGSVGTALAAVALVGWPRRRAVVLAFLVIDLAYGAYELPQVPNHRLFTLMLDALLLVSLAEACRARAPQASWIVATWTRFVPAARLVAVTCYGASAVAKFNTGFFDPQVSCASGQYLMIAEHFLTWLPQAEWAQWAAIWGTAGIELAVTVCLLVPAWQTRGACLGTVFHYFLAATPIVRVGDFSTMLFGVFFLFLHESTVDRSRQAVLREPSDQSSLASRSVWATLLLVMVISIGGLLAWGHAWPAAARVYDQLRWGVFFVGGLGWCSVVLARTLVGSRRPGAAVQSRWTTPSWATLPVYAFAVLTVVSPYVGMKTRSNFAMFSNLRTEGSTSNHWFLPQLYLAKWQNDLVEIVTASDDRFQRFADEGKLLTWWEFSRLARAAPDASVTYQYQGHLCHVDRVGKVSELMRHPPWLLRKTQIFRPVDQDGACRCDW